MQIYIALLRGINVSGKNKILMTDLKNLFEKLQCIDVKTYIQSGNVIFKSDIKDKEDLANLISLKIEDTYGFKIPVIIKKDTEIQQIITNNPFYSDNVDTKKLYVTYLDSAPKDITKLKAFDFGKDVYAIVEDVIYLKYDIGAGKTKLTNAIMEKKLNVIATSRNWRTTNKIKDLVCD